MVGVPGHDPESLGRHPDGGRRDLRDDRLHPLPLLGRAARDEDVPPRVEPHGGAVLGGDARAPDPVEHRGGVGHLDEAREADSAMDPLPPEGVALRLEPLVVHRGEELREALLVGEILEGEPLRGPARVGVVRAQVPAAELGGVEAGRARRRVDQPLGRRALDGVPDGPVLAHHVLVLEDDGRLRPVVVEGVGAAHEVHDLVRLDATRAGIHRVGADAGQGVDLEGENGAVVLHRYPTLHGVIAGVDVGDEALHAVGDELDGALEEEREPGGRDLVRVGVHLDPERPADVARDDPHPVLVEAVVGGEDVLDHVRALGVVPHGELLLGRVPVRDDRPRLDANPGVAAEDVGLLYDVVGLGVRCVDIAEVRVAPPGEVVAEALVDDRGVRVEGGRRVGDGGEHLPVDFDPLGRVLRLRPALGDDRHHRLALPGRGVEGKRVLRRGLEALQVGEDPDPGVVDLGELAAGHDRDDPRGGLRGPGVDRAHARVGVRGPDERRVPGRPPSSMSSTNVPRPRRGEGRWGGERSGRCRSSAVQDPAVRDELVHGASPPWLPRAISTASTMAS